MNIFSMLRKLVVRIVWYPMMWAMAQNHKNRDVKLKNHDEVATYIPDISKYIDIGAIYTMK